MSNAVESANSSLREWITRHDGIKQRSSEWLECRKLIVGGSEIASVVGSNSYKNINSLAQEKLGLTQFRGNIYCNWGVLFEPVIAKYAEIMTGSQIIGDDIFVYPDLESQRGVAYSPDGLSVIMRPDESPQTALWEFKCPMRRIPGNIIPSQYVPQLMTGLDVIRIADIGVFVDGSFRMCRLSECMLDDPSYDNVFQPRVSARSSAGAIACGIIGFSTNGDLRDTAAAEDLGELEHCVVSEVISNCCDSASRYLPWYPPEIAVASDHVPLNVRDKIYFPQRNDPASCEIAANFSASQQVAEFYRHCAATNRTPAYILPWKLIKARWNTALPIHDYLQPYMNTIQQINELAKAGSKTSTIAEKQRLLWNFMCPSDDIFFDDELSLD